MDTAWFYRGYRGLLVFTSINERWYRYGETVGRGNPQVRHPERGAVRHDKAAVGASSIRQQLLKRSPTVPIRRAHHCGRVREFFKDSLNALGLDYVDLVSNHGMHRSVDVMSHRGST